MEFDYVREIFEKLQKPSFLIEKHDFIEYFGLFFSKETFFHSKIIFGN